MGKKSNQARFPAARIKKMIQADDDVGKVAQGTPIVVSKALELFLGSLVGECVKNAQAKGSKKITAYGLKKTVTDTPLFDFCSDIVANVADPLTEEGGEEGAPKKRKPRAKKPKDEGEGEDAYDSEGAEKPKPKRKRVAKPKGEPKAKAAPKGKGKATAKKEDSEGEAAEGEAAPVLEEAVQQDGDPSAEDDAQDEYAPQGEAKEEEEEE